LDIDSEVDRNKQREKTEKMGFYHTIGLYTGLVIGIVNGFNGILKQKPEPDFTKNARFVYICFFKGLIHGMFWPLSHACIYKRIAENKDLISVFTPYKRSFCLSSLQTPSQVFKDLLE
jgi:hypothetical protein